MSSVVVDVAPPRRETATVRFNDFANLPAHSGVSILSPDFSCLGFSGLRVKLYPGGTGGGRSGFIGVFLSVVAAEYDDSKFEGVGFSLCIRGTQSSRQYAEPQFNRKGFPAFPGHSGVTDGEANFARLSEITDLLVNGSLVIEVTLWSNQAVAMPAASLFVPKNPFNKFMIELLNDEESADVVFQVGGRRVKTSRKRVKASFTSFHAHMLVLKKCAPQLAEMCRSESGGKLTEVPINDVKPGVFRHVLYYIYGGVLEDDDLKGNVAKDILVAADRFGVVNLKLEAEARYVKSTEITVDNMVDELLYAESKTCPLLKEAVIDFVAKNGGEVLEKVSLDDVPREVFTELMKAVAGRGRTNASKDGDGYGSLRVSELRRRLDERGLDVDGSREAMIAALNKGDDKAH